MINIRTVGDLDGLISVYPEQVGVVEFNGESVETYELHKGTGDIAKWFEKHEDWLVNTLNISDNEIYITVEKENGNDET